MKNLWIASALTLTLVSGALTWEEFPPDTPDLVVVDRDYQTVYRDDQEVHYYAVLYNGEDQSFLEIYTGTPWKLAHRWPITFQDAKVMVRPRAALSIDEQEDGSLVFYWEDYAGYAEGAVRQSVVYDPKDGSFRTQWSD